LEGGIAHLFLCNNNLRYVIKFKNDRHGTKELVNEYIAYHLARLLSLPVVPYKRMYIVKNKIRPINKLLKKQFEPGNQYASLYIANCTGLPYPLPSVENIKNPHDLAGMIVFDHWIDNASRDYKNILFESLSRGRYHIHMIDHGSCFPGGYDWTAEKLKNGRGHVHDTVVYEWAMTFLKNRQLTSFIDRIQSLSDQTINKVIHSLPSDWDVSKEEKDAFISFLAKQKKRLPDLVSQFIRQYR
jgi:hypothetical protein